jgi:hypothetical protein
MSIHHGTKAGRRVSGVGWIVPFLLTVFFAAFANQAAAQIQPVDLGTMGGSLTSAVAVNASGQAVGFGFTADDVQTRAFSWTAPNGDRVPSSHLGIIPEPTDS